jgi:hypothetical protein
MRTRILLLLSTALLCGGECVQVGPPKFGRVEVSAFSGLGDRLPTLDVDLIEIGTHKSLKSRLNRAIATKVPYGTYIVRVSAPGLRRSEHQIRLDQPEIAVRVQLSVSAECAGFADVHGRILSAQAGRDLWVKLVPVRGVGGTETRVNADGSFLAGGLDEGQYFVLVIDAQTVVRTVSLSLPRKLSLDIDLAKN